MEDWNKLESVPAEDALIKEEPIIEVKPVEPVVEEAPAPTPAPKPVAPKVEKEDKGLVALYSEKNLVGIAKGYSKVDKNLAAELLKNKNVRLATPEEFK